MGLAQQIQNQIKDFHRLSMGCVNLSIVCRLMNGESLHSSSNPGAKMGYLDIIVFYLRLRKAYNRSNNL